MFRSYQSTFLADGTARVDISPFIESMEWDIYQVSVQTQSMTGGCTCAIYHNGFFLCSSGQGSLDSAYGPPDVVVMASDQFSVRWFNGKIGDTATVGIWFNENATGTTYSSAH